MRFILLITAILLAIESFGQQTGSFSMTIDFNEPDYSMSNELAFYVPTDYDTMTAYPLIVGFRGGPHTGPGHLRDQLQPLSDNLNAIVMCPESVSLWQGGQEDLVKALFQHAVDTTASLYNIDMAMIYVTGLSFGGRHTVLVGMDTDSGPIYPGLRGIIPFAAGMNSQDVANYGVDTTAPICTCIGLDDTSFYTVSYTLHLNATAAGHSTLFNEIPDVGHTMDFPTFIDEMMECFEFIEAQYVVAIEEYDDFEFEVFPNPAGESIQIKVAAGRSPRIELYDAQGILVRNMDFMTSGFGGTLDLSDLSSGSYLMTFIMNEEVTSYGIVEGSGERSSQWVIKQ